MTRPDSPLAGVFRVVYFLALAIVATFAVVTGVIGFYQPPSADSLLPNGFDSSGIDLNGDGNPDITPDTLASVSDETADYNRNVSLIYTVFAAGLFAIPILGLGSRLNSLRAGLIGGGLLLFLVGMGYWSDSSDQWIGFFTTLLCFIVLVFSFPWLEDGIPTKPRGPVRRIEIPPSGGPAPSPTPLVPPPPPPSPQSQSVPLWERPPPPDPKP